MSDALPREREAVASWTYVGPERFEEALLRIRRIVKESAGWWNDQDEAAERAAFERLGVGCGCAMHRFLCNSCELPWLSTHANERVCPFCHGSNIINRGVS